MQTKLTGICLKCTTACAISNVKNGNKIFLNNNKFINYLYLYI